MKSTEAALEARRVHFRSHKGSALTTSIALLLMAIIAGIAYGYVHPQIVIPGDSMATKQSILDNRLLFTAELVLWWTICLLDIIVALSLFSFFKENGPILSKSAMIFRLLYAGILGISIIILSTARNPETNSMLRIMQFERVWSIGLIFFGIHLLLLGFVALKNRLVPKLLSWLIVIGGLSYVLIHSLKVMTDGFVHFALIIEPYLAVPMALSEIFLSLWLMYAVTAASRKNATYA